LGCFYFDAVCDWNFCTHSQIFADSSKVKDPLFWASDRNETIKFNATFSFETGMSTNLISFKGTSGEEEEEEEESGVGGGKDSATKLIFSLTSII
jgi:hypothetical protein